MNTDTTWIKDTDEATFDEDVIQTSFKHLVLVDFWADWCGPCRSLAPVLDQVVTESQGDVRLVKVNTDQQQALAASYGIRSLPTVFLFKDGEAVDQFMGVQPLSEVRKFVNRHVALESDHQLATAVQEYGSGRVKEAIDSLLNLVAEDPANDRPKFVLAEWLSIEQDYDRAKEILDSISREGRNDSRYPALSAKIDLGAKTGSVQSPEELAESIAADGNNLEARFELARHLIQAEKLSEGLDQLLEILKRDRNFRQDEPRETILQVFSLAGGRGELVSQYRRRLAQVLN